MPYFDHNATTPVAPEVAEAFAVAVREVYGNPSSTHRAGQRARQHLEAARRTIAESLHASPPEVVFTSGGTESNNLAILGLVRHLSGEKKHVITTAIEHPCVLEACRQLEREGVAVTYLPVSADGLVDPDAVESELRPETVLVSVMHANNETGVMQPVREIAAVLRGKDIYFHSDGVQAFGKVPVDVMTLGVDLYSLSAHKIFAPKGTGALFVRKGTPLRGIQFGGRHERERRAGTENVPGAMAFARAVELLPQATQVEALRGQFERRVTERFREASFTGAKAPRLPNTSNLLLPGVSAEALVIALDLQGISVSTGAACSSGSLEPSHVLLAMGFTREEARSSVRFSFGRDNTPEEIAASLEILTASVGKLRRATAREAFVLV